VVVRSDARRLAALSGAASSVATQDFEAGLEPAPGLKNLAQTSTDEIGDVARAFVAMERAIGVYIDRLRRLAGELAHYNETLEATVATRTQELQEKNRVVESALEELKQAQDQILRQEKLASLGALTAGIAHEIKNPLNFVNNFSDLSWELLGELREDLDKSKSALDPKTVANVEDVIENLQLNLSKIKEHGVRADGIVRSMLLHSRGTSGQRQDTDLNALVRDAVGLAYHGMRAQDTSFQVAIITEFDPAVGLIEAVPQDLMRAFLNIVNNGCYAAYNRSKTRTDGGPEIRVTTKRIGDAVEIRMRDNGDGRPDAIIRKIFEPFFTTKPAGQGTGLGLSICHDIIDQQHKGTLSINTEAGVFTEFVIVLPGNPR
jgi:signal transduction histidine kinase